MEHEREQGDGSALEPQMDAHLLSDAAAAAHAERSMGLVKSFKIYRRAVLWSVFLSTCIIMEGFDTNLLNSLFAYKVFQQRFGVATTKSASGYEIPVVWQTALSNGALVGEILGLFANGIIADHIGYRKTLIGALTLVIGFIFIVFFTQSLMQLLIGEILLGIPWGVFQTLTTTYAAEVCPTHLRAYLTTYVNLCWVIGQFISSGVLRAMVDRNDDWGYRIPFAIQWLWPVPLIIGIWLAPESPWWLVRKGRYEDAKRSLERLTTEGSEEAFRIDGTIAMMVHTNELEKQVTAGYTYRDLFRGVNVRRTEIVCVTWIIQTLCGSTFMGYSTYFYEKAGMDQANAFSMSLGQYAFGIAGTISSWFLMGWFGRRTLYLGGQIFMAALLSIIGFTSLAKTTGASWAIGTMLLVYTFTYDATVGPVCYSLVAELTSTRLRTKSVVLARNLYNIVGIVTNIITPRMLNSDAWNWGAKAGFFWAGSCFLCAVWTYFRLPEPKGRTYDELDILFENHVSARKFASTRVDNFVAVVRTDSRDAKAELDVAQVERADQHSDEKMQLR